MASTCRHMQKYTPAAPDRVWPQLRITKQFLASAPPPLPLSRRKSYGDRDNLFREIGRNTAALRAHLRMLREESLRTSLALLTSGMQGVYPVPGH